MLSNQDWFSILLELVEDLCSWRFSVVISSVRME
jgi:hypothetical protein